MKHRLLAPAVALALAGSMLVQTSAATGTVLAQTTSRAVAQQVSTTAVSGTTLNLFSLPTASSATGSGVGPPHAMPLLPLGPRKGSASPAAGTPAAATPQAESALALSVLAGFNGMADSASICPYFGGCQPPDMALATSPTRVLQGVNTAFSLYNTKGGIVAGPVTAQNFFGVPNPLPANCDPAGPFLSDPRAFYDPNTGLMWASIMQVENALGLAPNCTYQSAVWIANLNPITGVIHSYRIATSVGRSGSANDYDRLGFNATTIGLGVNLFNRAGTAFTGDELQFLNKHAMESGSAVTPVVFENQTSGGVLLDTVQPVETEVPVARDPGVLYLVDSFNSPDASGNDCVTNACHGFTVFAYDPTTQNLSQQIDPATDAPYLIPPNADQPGCTQCIETIDARITATPVYGDGAGMGLISFAHATAVNNGTQLVPAAQWVQLQPMLTGHTLTSVTMFQHGTLALGGDTAVSFPAVMPDSHNNLYMVFDVMGHVRNPSIGVTSRLNTDPLGTMGPVQILKQGLTPTSDSRWGDYEATSYDGFTTNHVWVASQYSGQNTDWATWIAEL